MGLLDIVLPGKTKMEVAANIINAEYNFQNIPYKFTLKAFEDIAENLWKGYNRKNPTEALEWYLEMPRNLQMNILALAYNNTSTAPILNGEYWAYVKNPMTPNIYDKKMLHVVYSRITKQYSVNIQMTSRSLTNEDLGELLG